MDPHLLNTINFENSNRSRFLKVSWSLYPSGLPGFANFASEVMVFFATFKDFHDETVGCLGMLQWVGIIALWGVVISAVYGLRAFKTIFMGPREPKSFSISDLTWSDRLPILLLIGALLLVGFAPDVLLQFVAPIAEGIHPVAATQ